MSAGPCRRVLMTADGAGGVWTYAVDLAAELNARGVEVILATMGPPLTPTQRQQVADLPRTTTHESTWALEWMAAPWADVDAASDWLLDLAASSAPDIVHLSSLSHGAVPWPVPSVLVVHSCVLSWWQATQNTPLSDGSVIYRDRVRRGIHGADVVIAPTVAMLRSVGELYGHPRRAAVIPNGRRLRAVCPGPKQPVVLGAGRLWDVAKNLSALDRIAASISWPVRLAGPITSPEGHTARVEHAEWLGDLAPDRLYTAMAEAAVFAHPARYEPFGLAVLEAARAGCALVLGRIESLCELWHDAALFVPPGDDEALANAIRSLIASSDLRRQLAAAARARARRYTAGRMARRYIEWYRTARVAS